MVYTYLQAVGDMSDDELNTHDSYK